MLHRPMRFDTLAVHAAAPAFTIDDAHPTTGHDAVLVRENMSDLQDLLDLADPHVIDRIE